MPLNTLKLLQLFTVWSYFFSFPIQNSGEKQCIAVFTSTSRKISLATGMPCCRLVCVISSPKSGCSITSWLKNDLQKLSSLIMPSCCNQGQNPHFDCPVSGQFFFSEELHFQRKLLTYYNVLGKMTHFCGLRC